MEYTKESLVNTCILCTSIKQGKRALSFYEKYGFKIFFDAPNKLEKGLFIGLASYDNNLVSVYTTNYIKKIIKLPSTPRKKKLTFPREMWVKEKTWNHWNKHIVVAYLHNERWGYLVKKNKPIVMDEYIGYEEAKEIE
jgi:hypothetical protein